MQLLLLQAEHCSGISQFIKDKYYLSNDIVNEMIGLMSMEILREILSEIREVGIISLIADEATDTSQKEQLCVTIRWVDSEFQIHETPVELIQVPKTDSETLTSVLKDCLIRLALPIGQCRGQAYDGASNMSGLVLLLVSKSMSQLLFLSTAWLIAQIYAFRRWEVRLCVCEILLI